MTPVGAVARAGVFSCPAGWGAFALRTELGNARPPLQVQSRELIGRDEVLLEIATFLRRGHNVLLFGPAYVGKSSLIDCLGPHEATVIDPFEHVTPHLAAEVRRAMDRGRQFLVAARSLDRTYLGAVRRIAWRFTMLRVPPLANRVMQQLIQRECTRRGIPRALLTHDWVRGMADLSQGRPGVALAMVDAARRTHAAKHVLPLPPAAYVEARVQQEWPQFEHEQHHSQPVNEE